ncbi:hypothetical protein GOB94_08860 [Granulicella sp. 5B5]|uniref:hypothetical protein n=1 Tax=Granulicella sp. 5B5 TaxID=1617967 RepID=UPI0015F74CED|nr:hypothetical protein [Granulicella sp. 5B5]QMV18780.1 hypothetical protein GOB94_08860 [Granulicella sp. 5B5]
MADLHQTHAQPALIGAVQVAHDTEVRQSPNGVRFATFGETGLDAPDLDRILEAVPAAIVAALEANTYYFVPAALREDPSRKPVMVAPTWSDDLHDTAICHRNVELGSGRHGIFISTRLLNDRFALSFEFYINVAHAFVDKAGVPQAFADLAWQQALDNARGETSLDAFESRNLAFGRPANAMPDEPPTLPSRRTRAFAQPARSLNASAPIDEKERNAYLDAAFTDAIAIYLLSLAMDFNYSDLRERDYPLLTPVALAARLRLIAELFPPNPHYEFAIRYRRRA